MPHLLSENNNNSKILLDTVVWDSDIDSIGLPWYVFFSFGSEFGDIIYRLQKPKDNIRWCVYSVDRNYYIIKQERIDKEWVEVWSKQMDKDLDEAKLYCEEDALEHYA